MNYIELNKDNTGTTVRIYFIDNDPCQMLSLRLQFKP